MRLAYYYIPDPCDGSATVCDGSATVIATVFECPKSNKTKGLEYSATVATVNLCG